MSLTKNLITLFCNIANEIFSKINSSVLMEPSMISENTVESAVDKFKNHPKDKLINNTSNKFLQVFLFNINFEGILQVPIFIT